MSDTNTAAESGTAAPLQLLGKRDILDKEDLVFEIVAVPEWGGNVRVRSLEGNERDKFESSMVKQVPSKIKGQAATTVVTMENVRARLCALTIVDENGNRIFGDDEIKALGKKSAAALDRVYEVAMKLSKVSPDDIEEIKGNSDADRSDVS